MQRASESEVARVLLADVCPIVRSGLKELLRSSPHGAEVVGEAASAKETLQLATRLRPDFVVVDPDFGGGEQDICPKIDICRELKYLHEPPCVVVYTNHNSLADVAAIALAEADCYVHKSTDYDTLTEAGDRIRAGERVWLLGAGPKETEGRLLTAFKVSLLTRREKQIFELVLKRYSTRQIAEELYIGPQTTKNHIGHILRKLGCRTRADLFLK